MSSLDVPPTTSARLARLATEVFAPVVMIVVVTVVVAVHAAGLGWGLALAAVAAFFEGGLPYAVLLAGIRKGILSDRHLSRREERPAMMLIGLVSVGIGLLVMRWMDAPRPLFALVAAMTAGIGVSLAVTTVWKISIHAACTAGTIGALAVLVSPWCCLAVPVVVVTAWARVVLRDHTLAQVLVGSVVGAAVGAGVCLALS